MMLDKYGMKIQVREGICVKQVLSLIFFHKIGDIFQNTSNREI